MEQWFRVQVDGAVHAARRLSADGPIELMSGASILDPQGPTGKTVSLDGVRLLAPVAPSKYIGLWNNFRELAAKLGQPIPPEPLYFLKAPSSFANPHDAIRKPVSYDGKVVYEGELGIVIGRLCKDIAEDQAESAIFGFTCTNDVTAMDLITRDSTFAQWARAKSCDTFGPIGPAVVRGLNWRDLRVRTIVGGRERQNFAITDMVFTPAQIVSLLSREMTLLPGDIISCGTSLGVLPMRPNTTVEVVIDGIGCLVNTFEPAESAQPAVQ